MSWRRSQGQRQARARASACSRRDGLAAGPEEHPSPRLAPAVELANERLEAHGATPLPDGLSPHKLRHTFASLLVALGTDPGAVMDQLGHADADFTLRVYRHGMRRDEDSRAQLARLVGIGRPARKGTEKAPAAPRRAADQAAVAVGIRALAGISS